MRAPMTEGSQRVPKIRLKRATKQESKGQNPQAMPNEYHSNQFSPEQFDPYHGGQSMQQPRVQPRIRDKNDMLAEKFYEEQGREKREADQKQLETRLQEAQKNQMSKAQRDVKEDRCDECGKINCLVVKQHEGTMVCSNCGIVSQLSMIDQTNEKRMFSSDLGSADQSASRVQQRGSPYLPHNDSIVISGTSKEAKALQNYPMNKYDGHDRNLAEGQTKIKLLAENLNLCHADIKAMAFDYLKKIEDNKILKGKSLDAKVGCVMYYAARNKQRAKKVSEILHYVNSNSREINKCFKKCKELLKFVPMPPSQIIESSVHKLNLVPETLRAAKITADNFSKHSLCEGKRPQTIAGVSLFMVMVLSKKYKHEDQQSLLDSISQAVGIGAGTIKDTYNQIYKLKDRLLPEFLLGTSASNNNISGASNMMGASPHLLPSNAPQQDRLYR